MIRHVVLARFRPGVTDEQVDALVTAMQAVQVDGLRSLTCGRSAAIRPGGWDYALVADFDDEDAYLRYDNHPEHNRIRQELVPDLMEEAARAQMRV